MKTSLSKERIEMTEPGPMFLFLEYQTSATALKRPNSFSDQVQGQMCVMHFKINVGLCSKETS